MALNHACLPVPAPALAQSTAYYNRVHLFVKQSYFVVVFICPDIAPLPRNSSMAKIPRYTEPVSTSLRRHPQGDKGEIVSTLRWVAVVCLFIFLTLTFIFLLTGFYRSA